MSNQSKTCFCIRPDGNCDKCKRGYEKVEDNDYDNLKKQGYFGNACEHCYCKRMTTSIGEHLICCICGHRKLANPITY